MSGAVPSEGDGGFAQDNSLNVGSSLEGGAVGLPDYVGEMGAAGEGDFGISGEGEDAADL